MVSRLPWEQVSGGSSPSFPNNLDGSPNGKAAAFGAAILQVRFLPRQSNGDNPVGMGNGLENRGWPEGGSQVRFLLSP